MDKRETAVLLQAGITMDTIRILEVAGYGSFGDLADAGTPALVATGIRESSARTIARLIDYMATTGQRLPDNGPA